MIPFQNESNYYEIYIHPSLKKKDNSFEIGMNYDDFSYLLSCIARAQHDFKYFQKEYKEYIYNEVIVQNNNNTEIKVYRQNPNFIQYNNNCVCIGYTRNKMTFLNVPSTKNIFDINYVKKLIFRINNRIFINFQINMDSNKEKTYMVYINYNHEQNIDVDGVTQILNKIFDIFGISKQLESIS